MRLVPALITPASIIPLFHALVDLPVLVTVMQDAAERSPHDAELDPEAEALMALMDGAYLGRNQPEGGERGEVTTSPPPSASAGVIQRIHPAAGL